MTTLPAPREVAHFIASHISRTSSRGKRLQAFQLADVINEVTIETTITGAGTLTITVDDPDLALWTSGMLEVDDNGLLDTVEVNFPEGSDSWWRLCAVDQAWSTDLTQPNVTLTFEDRIVAYLRDKWGPKTVAPGTTTRAQFIHQLVQEVGRHDGLKPIKFVCPSINVVQPLAGGGTASIPASSGTPAQTAAAKTNKSQGVGAGAAITIKGSAPSSTQLALVNQVMGVANGLNAGTLATQALIETCIQENDFTNNAGGGGGSNGLLQLIPSTAAQAGISPFDVPGQVKSFLTDGYKSLPGGAIGLAHAHPSWPADQIAQAIQRSGAGASLYAQWLGEANKIIAAFGGVTSGSQTTGTPSKPISDVSQLTRGTANDPDESSWDCIQRLAQEVNWFAFSDANTLYFMDGPDLRKQKPAVYIELDTTSGPRWSSKHTNTGAKTVDIIPTLSGRFDNTAFSYTSSHPKKGKIQRRSRIAKPQTPTEIQFNLVSETDEFRAGEVVVFQGAGALNGRWIVGDCTRNVLGDTFSQLTVGPPTDPLPEPQGQQPQQAAGTTSVPGASAGGFTNPVPGMTISRLDMGIDGTGSTFVAPFSGTVMDTSRSGWGGGFMSIVADNQNVQEYQKAFYLAEGIHPVVSVGQHVTAGQKIADPAVNGFNGITGNVEFGPATPSPPHQPLALSVSNPKSMVLAYYNWMRTLGIGPTTNPSNAGFP